VRVNLAYCAGCLGRGSHSHKNDTDAQGGQHTQEGYGDSRDSSSIANQLFLRE
jgi:hypothetical protein